MQTIQYRRTRIWEMKKDKHTKTLAKNQVYRSIRFRLPKFIKLCTGNVDCKTVGFFLKISKEIGKACRKSLTREAREPHTPVGLVRREKKNRLSVFHTVSSFRPGGSKMSSSCQKSVYNSTLFVNLVHSVIDFEGE